ncbi:MAG: NUDIX domain-containing protein [Euryarchaeota archaeon]|nr:NUDIX domain-containing protein [Euryarchaeota archaeon]
MTHRRKRGTAIVETSKGILVTSGHKRVFILPGGGANKGETRMQGAIRELREETGLVAYDAKYIFSHVGLKNKTFSGKHYFRDHHKVFLIKAIGNARPRHEVKHIAYYKPENDVRVSHTTKSIIDRYYKWKEKREREREEKGRFFAVHEQSPSN